MSGLRRRHFLAAVAGAAATIPGTVRAAAGTAVAPTASTGTTGAVPRPPQVPLGKTGITLSRVGQGTGMHGGGKQSDHTRMGFEQLVKLFIHDYERGVTFFDLADLYGTHVYFREALRTIPKKKAVVMTKLWWRHAGRPGDTPAAFLKKSTTMAIQRFCEEISRDYIDICLLHCLQNPSWASEMEPYMEALDEAKKKGRVRAVGVSCHNLGAVKTAASLPWVDVVLARINPFSTSMDGKTEEVLPVLKQIKANGKALIGMKIYGEGRLADRKDECIKFAQNSGLIDCMTVGAMTPEQMDETLRLIARYPAAKVG